MYEGKHYKHVIHVANGGKSDEKQFYSEADPFTLK